MKFSLAYILAALCATAAGQSVTIAFPEDGATVSAGSDITVEIDRPNFNSQATEIAIVLAVQSGCPCDPPSESGVLGPFLEFNGPFTPMTFPGDNELHKPPHQNFTVTVPDLTGQVQLNVFHVSLVGASNEPFSETLSIALNVV